MSATEPARNRVSPLGDVIAVAGRGAWMGNRGRLHEGRGSRDIVCNHQGKTWITCRLSFKDRHYPQWEPRRFTPLFLLDEAVAFAAGHRPCAECRRQDYHAYRDAWVEGHGGTMPYAKNMDDQLHRERLGRGPYDARWDSLPDGVFVMTDAGPAVLAGDHLAVWSATDNAYRQHLSRPRVGDARVITPQSNVHVLRAGCPVQIDDAAR